MKILQVDFKMEGPFGDEMSKKFEWLANDIVKEEGFLWKIWTENPEAKEAGGIYCFDTLEAARKYLQKHMERLHSFGITDITAKIFDINVPLSSITKGDAIHIG